MSDDILEVGTALGIVLVCLVACFTAAIILASLLNIIQKVLAGFSLG